MEETYIYHFNIQGGVNKANLSMLKMIILGIFAGMFIAIGAEASSLAVHSMSNAGLARFVAGCIFPVGLMMIVAFKAELFTGNTMLTMAFADKKISFLKMLRNLVVVYISNLIGSVFVAAFVFLSGQFDTSAGGLGAYTIKVAMGKTDIDFTRAIISGVMCNILVCVAVLMAGSTKDLLGKLFACFFPIMVFVTSGFEHCVANMYYIPAGMFAKTCSKYVDKACELYGYTESQIENSLTLSGFFGNNLLPVTIGNIIGGGIIVGLGIYILAAMEKKQAAK